MVRQNITRLCACMTTLLLLTVTIYSQEAPPEIRARFLRAQPTVQLDRKREKDFFKPFGKATWISYGACVATGGLDIIGQKDAESRGYIESNSLLRNKNMTLNVRRALVAKMGICSLPFLIEKRHPRMATVARFVFSAAWSVMAAYNFH